MLKYFFLLFFTNSVFAANTRLTLDLQNVNLADSIQLMAKFLQKNIILSPVISGTVSLHLQEANADAAFNLLLTTYGLAKWKMGNVWYVAPRNELIKAKQEEIKWQTLWEQTEPLKTACWQIQYGKVEEIAAMMQDSHANLLSKRGQVRTDKRTNTICLQDLAAGFFNAQKLINQLDVPVKQVLIKTRIASVDRDYEHELGVAFAVTARGGSEATAKGLLHEGGIYSLAIVKLADNSLLDVKLSALEQSGHAELISSPSLFTANQQPASIEAGEEVPYQEVSESGGTAVVFKKAVLGLKVTPQVLPGNKVLLHLQINQDRPSNRLVQGVPTISTREIRTSVLIANGQTVVLGGIYETTQEQAENRLPILSQVPLIGGLFKQELIRKNKRELLIFVTPRLLSSNHNGVG